MAVAYYDWIGQVLVELEVDDQVAYIITAAGAPSKGILKVGKWVTDTSFSTEYDPSLSRMY
jgi:hypothetical protein